jgi:hypothetical protein
MQQVKTERQETANLAPGSIGWKFGTCGSVGNFGSCRSVGRSGSVGGSVGRQICLCWQIWLLAAAQSANLALSANLTLLANLATPVAPLANLSPAAPSANLALLAAPLANLAPSAKFAPPAPLLAPSAPLALWLGDKTNK